MAEQAQNVSMADEAERKAIVFNHVRSLCADFDESALFQIKNEDDALDILLVKIWAFNSGNNMLSNALRFFATAKLPPCLENVNVYNLINRSGIFADVFVQHFEKICDEAPADAIRQLTALRNRVTTPAKEEVFNPRQPYQFQTIDESGNVNVPLLRQLSSQPAENEAFQSLRGELLNAENEESCAGIYESRIGEALVRCVHEFKQRNETKISSAGEILRDDDEMEDMEDMEDTDIASKNLFNKIVDELNVFLKRTNEELVVQRDNFSKMCELIPRSQQQFQRILRESKFTKEEIAILAKNGFMSLESAQTIPEVVVSVCGETSTGKTTLISGITTSRCFPTSDAANSACPVRICVSNDRSQARSFYVPSPFKLALEAAYEAIQWTINSLQRDGIPADMPVNVTSKEGIEMFQRLFAAGHVPSALQLDVVGATADSEANDNEILKSIDAINGLVRLFYNLKDSHRYAARLGNVDPIGVLLEAPDILEVLPTLISYCECVQTLPFAGRINFIDTPGVSEAVEKGSFMEFNKRIIKRIFERSDRTIVLVTPTTISSGASRELRKLIRSSVSDEDKMVVAVNKFDTAEVATGEHGLEEKLNGYRDEFAKEGLHAVHVQTLNAKALRDVYFGWKDLMDAGGMDGMREGNNLSSAAVSLLTTVCGCYWDSSRTDDDVEEECRLLSRQTNFDNILRVALLPAFLKVMTKQPLLCLKHHFKMISGMTTSLSTRLAATLKKKEALRLLQDSIDSIENLFLKKIQNMSMIHEIHDQLLNEFVSQAQIMVRQTKPRIHAAVKEAEDEAIKANGFHPLQSPRRALKTTVLYRGIDNKWTEQEASVNTVVFFRKSSEAALENKRVKTQVANLLNSTGIEAAWEKTRANRIKAIIEYHLRIIGDAIKEPLKLEFADDQHLHDMYESIFNDISQCIIKDAPPINHPLKLEFVLGELKTEKEAEGWAGSWLWKKEGIFVPAYQAIGTLSQISLIDHYSPESCSKLLDDMDMYHLDVVSRVGQQLSAVQDHLRELINQIDIVADEDPNILKAKIACLHHLQKDYSVLIKAIEYKWKSEEVKEEEKYVADQIAAWKERMRDCPADAVQAVAEGNPIGHLFEDADATYAAATHEFIIACDAIEGLNGNFVQLQNEVQTAMLLAVNQMQNGQMPIGMTLDELAMVKLYTLPGRFFGVVNGALRTLDVEAIRAMRKAIFLLKKATSKLLPPQQDTVFRGIALELPFQVGDTIVWNAFTSTSTSLRVSGGCFIGDGSTARTHCCIRLADDRTAARSLRQVSSVTEEDEVLLPPFTMFVVYGVSEEADGRMDVFLREVPGSDPIMAMENVVAGPESPSRRSRNLG